MTIFQLWQQQKKILGLYFSQNHKSFTTLKLSAARIVSYFYQRGKNHTTIESFLTIFLTAYI